MKYINVYKYTYVYICIYMYPYVYIEVCMYVHVCVYVCVCACESQKSAQYLKVPYVSLKEPCTSFKEPYEITTELIFKNRVSVDPLRVAVCRSVLQCVDIT